MGIYAQFGPSVFLTNSDIGYWSETNHHDEWTVGPQNRGFRDHAAITPSDHVSSTPWYREVVEVLSESPAEWHVIVYNGGGHIVENYKSVRWSSPNVGDPAFWYPPDGYFPIAQNVSDKVSNQARNNLSKGGFETGVAIGEAKQTAEMLATRGSQMARAIMDFRSFAGSLGPAKGRLAAAFAGAWLEGYYGWGSLARDAFSLHSTLTAQMGHPLILKTGSKGSDKYTLKYGDQSQSTSEWTHRSEVGYKYKIDNEFVQSAQKWGLTNPFAIAWELVPLSFVVDWFTPIGNTLSAISATAGLTFVDGYHTEITECYDEYRRNKPVFLNPVSFDPGSYKRHIYRMIRGKLYDFEPPKLYANRNPFSTNRVTSAVALITQAVFGHK